MGPRSQHFEIRRWPSPRLGLVEVVGCARLFKAPSASRAASSAQFCLRYEFRLPVRSKVPARIVFPSRCLGCWPNRAILVGTL
eukprot:5561057-Alexandrium_andersonii.AAC.1